MGARSNLSSGRMEVRRLRASPPSLPVARKVTILVATALVGPRESRRLCEAPPVAVPDPTVPLLTATRKRTLSRVSPAVSKACKRQRAKALSGEELYTKAVTLQAQLSRLQACRVLLATRRQYMSVFLAMLAWLVQSSLPLLQALELDPILLDRVEHIYDRELPEALATRTLAAPLRICPGVMGVGSLSLPDDLCGDAWQGQKGAGDHASSSALQCVEGDCYGPNVRRATLAQLDTRLDVQYLSTGSRSLGSDRYVCCPAFARVRSSQPFYLYSGTAGGAAREEHERRHKRFGDAGSRTGAASTTSSLPIGRSGGVSRPLVELRLCGVADRSHAVSSFVEAAAFANHAALPPARRCFSRQSDIGEGTRESAAAWSVGQMESCRLYDIHARVAHQINLIPRSVLTQVEILAARSDTDYEKCFGKAFGTLHRKEDSQSSSLAIASSLQNFGVAGMVLFLSTFVLGLTATSYATSSSVLSVVV